jgi:Tfp pilus assembly protein PilP
MAEVVRGHRSARLVAVTLVAVLVLASCGSSSTGSSIDSGVSTAPAAASPDTTPATDPTSTRPDPTSPDAAATTTAPAARPTTAKPAPTTAAPASATSKPAPQRPPLEEYPIDWMSVVVAASTADRPAWLAAVTEDEEVRRQLVDLASQPLELVGSCEFLVGGQSCRMRRADGTEWEISYVAGSAGEGISGVQRIVADPCVAGKIAGDLGAGVTVIEGLCLDGWAYVTTNELGDSQFIARYDGSRWTNYVAFPTPMCRSEIVAAGAPLSIVDRVRWQCQGAAGGERPTVSWDGEWRPATERTVRLGQYGRQVEWLQDALVLRGYSLDVDGYFGYGTEAAVRQFQRDRGLLVDGIAGDEVWGAIGE